VQTHSDHPPSTSQTGTARSIVLTELQLLHLQCQHKRSWEAYTMTLEGGGVLKNAGSCYLTLQGLQLYPALRGETEFSAQIPVLFTPHRPGGSFGPRDGSFAADVLKRNKSGAAVNQHFLPSHRRGHKHTVPCTRFQYYFFRHSSIFLSARDTAGLYRGHFHYWSYITNSFTY
jgi:hypothetical protein